MFSSSNLIRKRKAGQSTSSTSKKPRNWRYLIQNYGNLPDPDPVKQQAGQLLDDLVADHGTGVGTELSENWNNIRTVYRTGKAGVHSFFNIRLQSGQIDIAEIKDYLWSLFEIQNSQFKINIGFGIILGRETMDNVEYKYFWSSNSIDMLFPEPKLITNMSDMDLLVGNLETVDIVDHLSQRRPNTKWKFVMAANMTLRVYHLHEHPIGAPAPNLPPYLVQCKGVNSVLSDKQKNRMVHPDCFFRCLAAHNNNNQVPDRLQSVVNGLKEQYKTKYNLGANFKGAVKMEDMTKLEETFQVRVSVYHMDSPETCKVVRRTPLKTKMQHMKLDLTDNHFSLIKDMSIYCKSWKCELCNNFVTKQSTHLLRHKKICTGKFESKPKYSAGRYYCKETIFEKLVKMGIKVEEEQKYMHSFTCWDLESAPLKIGEEDPAQGAALTYEDRQVAIACAVCSTVDGYTDPICLKIDYDETTRDLVKRMLDYFLEISTTASEQERLRLETIFDQLDAKIEEYRPENDDAKDVLSEHHRHMARQYEKLKKELEKLCDRHILFTFNGAKFDNRLIYEELIEELKECEIDIEQIIKRQGAYTLIGTEAMIFRDFSTMLAAGTSLDKFMASQGFPGAKLAFPWDWFTSMEKLKQREFPKTEEFTSALKGTKIEQEEYNKMVEIFNAQCMDMYDYLEIYAKSDVTCFVPSILKVVKFWNEQGICPLTSAISIPGLSVRLMEKCIDPNLVFYLPNKNNTGLHETLRKGVVGGLSLVWSRLHVKDLTRIRGGPKLVKKVVGWDANSLYLHCQRELPIGIPIQWKKDGSGNLVNTKLIGYGTSMKEAEWVMWTASKLDHAVDSYFHGTGQGYLGGRRFRFDMLDWQEKTAYSFVGCYWHGHNCKPPKSLTDSDKMKQKRREFRDCEDYLETIGWKHVKMMECEWDRIKKTNVAVMEFIKKYLQVPNYQTRMLTPSQLLKMVEFGQIYGCGTFDLAVPEELRDQFNEFGPFIYKRDIKFKDIGPTMQRHVVEHKLSQKARTSLVCQMTAKDHFVTTPLLKYYLSLGIRVDAVHTFFEYMPTNNTGKFSDLVIHYRKQGDVDPSQKCAGESWKLAGNSSYGKRIERKDLHENIKILNAKKAEKAVCQRRFLGLDPVGEYYEVRSKKTSYIADTPVALGSFILNAAKHRMLEFYYSFLKKFIPLEDFELISTDTDSIYAAISADTLEELVPPHLKEEFERVKPSFMVTSPETNRDTGLFKVEWEGEGMVQLQPKTYCCFPKVTTAIASMTNDILNGSHLFDLDAAVAEEEQQKCKRSTKGCSKRLNPYSPLAFMDVLRSQQALRATNRGFLCRNRKMYSTVLQKKGPSYDYVKRVVAPNHISTTMLAEPEEEEVGNLDQEEQVEVVSLDVEEQVDEGEGNLDELLAIMKEEEAACIVIQDDVITID